MKRTLLFLIPVLTMALFLITSCKKDDNNNNANPANSPQGVWTGTGQYGTAAGNPTYVFTINFKAGGNVDITGNNNTSVDNATGTWTLIADSVYATYKYASSSAIYKLAGKFSAGSNVMAGTIGLNPATTMVGIFTVTR